MTSFDRTCQRNVCNVGSRYPGHGTWGPHERQRHQCSIRFGLQPASSMGQHRQILRRVLPRCYICHRRRMPRLRSHSHPRLHSHSVPHSASTRLYYDKDGLEKYALDLILDFSRGLSPLVDATWDEFMQLDIEEGITTRQEYFTLPICANDLNFELVRVQIGMGSEPTGPYLV